MPRLDDTREALLGASENAQKRVHRAWEGFQDFALRDNVLEVAVGLMYTTISRLPDIRLTPFAQTRRSFYERCKLFRV